jgi:hypothetical protein
MQGLRIQEGEAPVVQQLRVFREYADLRPFDYVLD